MPARTRKDVPATCTTKIKIPLQERMRNESRAPLFQDPDEFDEQGSEAEKIEFEIEEEEEADETSKKQMNQLVVARMFSGSGERKASTANETFQSVLAASGHASEDSEMRRVLLSQNSLPQEAE